MGAVDIESLDLVAGRPCGVVEVVGNAGVALILKPRPLVLLPERERGDADGCGELLGFSSAAMVDLGFLIGELREMTDFLCLLTEGGSDGA